MTVSSRRAPAGGSPEGISFGRELSDAFAAHGDRVAIVAEREEITYAGILDRVGHIAANLRDAGVNAGAFAGLAMQDTVDVLLATLACWRLSATPVVIDFRAPGAHRAALARDFGLTVVFESHHMPGGDAYPAAIFDTEWQRRSAPSAELPFYESDANPAFLIFSSGTTGFPKAYIQTHASLSRRMTTRKALIDSAAMRFLTPMALTYSATRHQVFGYLLRGGTIRLLPPLFSPSELAEALLAFRASGTALPPSVIARLIKLAGPSTAPLFPDLSMLASVGGPARADDKVGAYTLLSSGYRIGYASSLTGMIALLAGPDVLRKPETTGRAVESARIEIIGVDGAPLPAGEAGTIKAWTPTIAPAMLGPGGQLTVDPETMGPDWGIPGDLGYLDDEGFLTIVDRQADMIVRGGVNVAPQEIEKLIARHPKVTEVAVVGFPDETQGQEIAAFIVSDHGDVDDFIAFMRANIAPERRPREVRLVAALPYNEHGKLLRRRLADEIVRERLERE